MQESSTIFNIINSTSKHFRNCIAMQILVKNNLLSITYEELLEEVSKLALLLKRNGVEPGFRVALIGKSSISWVIQFLAIVSLNATAVPLDPGLEEKQIIKQLQTADPFLVIIDKNLYDSTFSLEDFACPLLVTCMDNKPELIEPISLKTYLDDGDKDIAAILFTSGTTGDFKGVELTHNAIYHAVKIGIETVKAEQADNFLCILPSHHVYGLIYTILAPLFIGAKITFVEAIQGDIILSTMAKTQPTIFLGVPRIFELFVNKILSEIRKKPKWAQVVLHGLISTSLFFKKRCKLNLGKLFFSKVHHVFGGKVRYFVSGSSALGPQLYQLLEGFGFTVIEGYGLTETSACVAINSADNPKQGAVGRPPQGTSIEIRDIESGKGEICVKGPTVMRGYFRNPEATSEVLKGEWFYTGDLGTFDESGHLIIRGRLKDIIVLANGKKVMASLVEGYYQEIPEIEDIAIVGIPLSNGNGEQLAAAIKLSDKMPIGFNLNQYKQLVRSKIVARGQALPEWWTIQKIYFVQKIPKTTTLKVKRNELLAQLDELSKGAEKASPSIKVSFSSELLTPEAEKILICIQSIINVDSLEHSISLTPLTSLRMDIGLDSLSKLELIYQLESAFNFKISPSEFNEVDTISDLLSFINERCGKQGEIQDEADVASFEIQLNYKETLFKRAFRKSLAFIYKKYFRLSGLGKQHLPEEPFFLCGNHVSHLDTLALILASGKPFNDFIILAAKDYFFNNKIKVKLISLLFNMLPFDRSGTPIAIKKNEALLQQCKALNKSIILFPEGTRSITGELQDFKLGAAMFANKLNMCLVPAFIDGTYLALPKGKKIPKAKKVTTYFGEPIHTALPDDSEESAVKYKHYQAQTTRLRNRVASLRQEAQAID